MKSSLCLFLNVLYVTLTALCLLRGCAGRTVCLFCKNSEEHYMTLEISAFHWSKLSVESEKRVAEHEVKCSDMDR